MGCNMPGISILFLLSDLEVLSRCSVTFFEKFLKSVLNDDARPWIMINPGCEKSRGLVISVCLA